MHVVMRVSAVNSVNFKGIKRKRVTTNPNIVLPDNLQSLKQETDKFPQDAKYRKQLLANSGLNPNEYYKIRTILGLDEIKSFMTEFNENENVYSVGEKDKNINNFNIRANLHMHTLASDGFLPIQELLDKAADYADKAKEKYPSLKEPFIVGITDHDTTESDKEAIKIIYNNPEKYKNLRVILGVEMTTFNNILPKLVQKPTNTHVLAYGVDPNEKHFSNFIDSTKQKKLHINNLMIKTANKFYEKKFGHKDFFSVAEDKEYSNILNKDLIGIHYHAVRYMKTKYSIENILLKSPKYLELFKQNNLPTNSNDMMRELNAYYYPIDKNNKSRSPINSLSEFISAKTNLPQEEVKAELEKMSEPHTEIFNELDSVVDKYKATLKPKYHYIPKFKNLYNGLKKQDHTIIGVAHPLDTVIKIEKFDDKLNFLTELYKDFVKSCKKKAGFTEAYYQSYNKYSQALKDNPVVKSFLDNICKAFNLFKTGSADTHRTNIFKRFY